MSEVANTTGTTAADLMDSLRGRPNPESPGRSFETPSIEPTSDGYVGFNTNTRTQFDSFLLMIERPDLVDEGFWAAIANRIKNWEEWNGIIHDWTTEHTTAEVVALAAELRIPVAPVSDGPAVADLEQANARGSLFDDPSGTFRVPRRPWRIDGELAPPPRPAPRLGEHTGTVVPRPPKPPATHGPELPLQGVKVVDLTAWWAGPSASAMLAALGADVVHVESVTRADGMRYTSGVSPDRDDWWEYSALFHVSNTNKRDLTLDLTRPEGRSLALRLIEQADLVLENYTPRVIEQFDLGWDVVHATNPRAVMVRMPAFGLDGPWRDRPGFAQTMEQVTGLAWLTGHVDDQPRIQRGPCDPNGGMHAVVGALVALERRDRSGVGSLVESTMFEAALNISAELIVEWTKYGNASTREGSRSPWAAPQGVYATDTRERWLVLSVATDEQWSALVDALGRPDWATDPALRTHEGRRAAHDLLDEKLGAWAARDRPRQGGRPARLGGGAGGTGGRRPAHVGAPAVRRPGLLRVPGAPGDRRPRPPVGAVPVRQRRPLAPPRGTDPRSAQPRDPHRPRPLRGGDRRARGRRPDRHPTPRTLREQTMPTTGTPTDLFDRVDVIDVDTHLTEPPDTWTARVPASLREQVPHVERIDGDDVWMASGRATRASRLLLDGRPRRRHAGLDPEDVRRDPRGDVRRRRPAAVPRRAGHPTPRCSTPTSAASGTATSCASAIAIW